jgi:hypothetical protein
VVRDICGAPATDPQSLTGFFGKPCACREKPFSIAGSRCFDRRRQDGEKRGAHDTIAAALLHAQRNDAALDVLTAEVQHVTTTEISIEQKIEGEPFACTDRPASAGNLLIGSRKPSLFLLLSNLTPAIGLIATNLPSCGSGAHSKNRQIDFRKLLAACEAAVRRSRAALIVRP